MLNKWVYVYIILHIFKNRTGGILWMIFKENQIKFCTYGDIYILFGLMFLIPWYHQQNNSYNIGLNNYSIWYF